MYRANIHILTQARNKIKAIHDEILEHCDSDYGVMILDGDETNHAYSLTDYLNNLLGDLTAAIHKCNRACTCLRQANEKMEKL